MMTIRETMPEYTEEEAMLFLKRARAIESVKFAIKHLTGADRLAVLRKCMMEEQNAQEDAKAKGERP